MPRQESEPPMVAASRWVHQITSIAMELALLTIAGYWLDRRWGTSPWLVIIGACVGFLVSGLSLAQMIKRLSRSAGSRDSRDRAKTTDNSGPSQQ
jgi:F0F1-type ATP synthase assembly protein I